MAHRLRSNRVKEWIYRTVGLLKGRSAGNIAGSEEVKDLIMRRFENWLDEVLSGEKPLEGIDQELFSELTRSEDPGTAAPVKNTQDLYETWSAITALTQEVKLQGRAFRELSHRLEGLPHSPAALERMAEVHRETVAQAVALTESLRSTLYERQRELEREAERCARNTFLDAVLDIRDRLMIGLKTTRESQEALDALGRSPRGITGWFRAKTPLVRQTADIAAGLKKGYLLGLERLEETLQEYGVHEIPCAGERFDPATMRAVDIEETTDLPDGTVMDVYRPGYASDRETIRTAHVKVARGPHHSQQNGRQIDES